jgi:hypothetical protein
MREGQNLNQARALRREPTEVEKRLWASSATAASAA